jgi:hypothetical protein
MKWFKLQLEGRFEIKTKLIGSGEEEVKEERVLNRVLRCTPSGWEYEADQRHAELVSKTLNLLEAKPVQTPGEDVKPWLEKEEEEELKAQEAGEYRALAARANYLALDRSDVQYPVKELCRGMARPTRGDKRKLKRLARYLVGQPRVVWQFPFQGRQEEITGFSDSDWAGCRRTAKSTSGGALMIGRHCVKSWSSTQKNVTLSSGEAELVAAVKTCTETIGVTQLAADWGVKLEGRIYVDSTAAIGVAHRKGNGKLRHVKVGLLWIQEKVDEDELRVEKILGTENPADLMTKNLGWKKIEQFMSALGQTFRDGRAERSLKL